MVIHAPHAQKRAYPRTGVLKNKSKKRHIDYARICFEILPESVKMTVEMINLGNKNAYRLNEKGNEKCTD